MTRFDRLRREALASCKIRGHKMRSLARGIDFAIWTCSVCGAGVQVLTHPQPNEIDIGGPAVALNCPVMGDGND